MEFELDCLSSDEDPSESLSRLNRITHRVSSMASIEEKQNKLSETRNTFMKVLSEYQKKTTNDKQHFNLIEVIQKVFKTKNAKTNLVVKNLQTKLFEKVYGIESQYE